MRLENDQCCQTCGHLSKRKCIFWEGEQKRAETAKQEEKITIMVMKKRNVNGSDVAWEKNKSFGFVITNGLKTHEGFWYLWIRKVR